MHLAFVEPHAVPSFHETQRAVADVTFEAGGMAVEFNIVQDHLGFSGEGFTAEGT